MSDIARKTLISRTAIRVPRRLRYKGTRKARLWRLRAKAVALALALGAATSGCSLSYKLDSFMATDADLEHTGSIGAAAASPAAPAGTERAATADNDLVFAKAVALALALGAATSGCSLSYKLDSFMAKDADLEHTGSIGAAAASPAGPETAATADNDLVFAKAAATDLLARPEKGVSRNWENPRTGARGTVTAVAEAYTSEGFKCRDFLASYMRDGSETWLQGDACRIHQGKWTVRSLQPLKRPS